MIRVGKDSKLSADRVVEKAIAFFGQDGLGLDVVEEGDCCVRFEGAGGHVFVQADGSEGGSGASVTVEGREWERQIKEFLGKI